MSARREPLNGKPCVAVLGTGSIGMRHLQVLKRMETVRPVAIPNRPARLRQLQEAGYVTAPGVSEAVQQGVSLYIIATDTGRHVPDGLAALEVGCDVLVEKPLATNAQEARRLIACAAELGRRVFVGCVLRFSESLGTFRRMLSGVGRLHAVRIECQSYLPDWRPERPYRDSYSARADEGGVLRDLIHEIDYAGWLFGWPTAVQAKVKNLGRLGIEADELVELSWETTSGCLLSLYLDYLSRPPRRRLRACGEQGTIEWDGVAGTVTLALAGNPEECLRMSQTWDEMFVAQVRAFIQASWGECDPRLAKGEDGVKALAVCDAARRASASHRGAVVEYQ